MPLVIDVDEDQADWGSTKLYDDGDLSGLWVADKGIGHWGGKTIPPTLHVNCRRILRGWQRYHINSKGWRDIAYNYAFCNHGVTIRCRGWNPSGATSGDFEGDGIPENNEAVAIVWIGGSGGQMTDLAFEAAGQLWRRVLAEIDLEPQVGIGHRDVKQTSCPGNRYYDWIWEDGWIIAPPPPPPTLEDTMLPLKYGDGFTNGQHLTYPPGHPQAGAAFTTTRRHKRSDVRGIQGVLRDAGADVNLDGKYTVKTAEAVMKVTPSTGADSNGFEFHGNDYAPSFKAAYGQNGGGLGYGDIVKLAQP